MQNCTAVDNTLTQELGLQSPNFIAQLLPKLVDLVRVSRRLPLGEEHAIRRGSRDFVQASKELGQRSVSIIHRALSFVDPAHAAIRLEDLANFNLVVDNIDSILEHVDSCLSEAMQDPSSKGAQQSSSAHSTASRPSSGARGQAKSGIPKPQIRWRHLIANERTQFVPRLLVKHNQKTPLSQHLFEAQQKSGLRSKAVKDPAFVKADASEQEVKVVAENSALQSHLSSLGISGEDLNCSSLHPYADELDSLEWDKNLFEIKQAEPYGKMEDTPLVFVQSPTELRQMISEIQATCVGKEIAVDVEHHDFRSYRGFVCLIQISTRTKDFIVDPFDMFEQMHMLNEIFSDPIIVKVLHGADRDIIWLQRDFSVFVVNMFDTGQATRVLRLQGGFSLANLVHYFCGIKLDKTFQTADWRDRPLSSDMVYYARCDTHYLLYCYDCVKNALLSQNVLFGSPAIKDTSGMKVQEDGIRALRIALEKSVVICKQVYSESPLDAGNAAMNLCERFGSKQRPLDAKQFEALQALVAWRDKLARHLDESLNFISPDACLWRIAFAMPSSPSHLRSSCNPLPTLLQQHALEIVQLVATGPEKRESPQHERESKTSEPDEGMVKPNVDPSSPFDSPSQASHAQKEMVANQVEWPARSASSLQPILHVTVSSHRNTTDTKSHAILYTLFEPGTSDDEAEPLSVAPEITRKPIQLETARPSIVCPTISKAVAKKDKKVRAKDKEGEVEYQSLRDMYRLPKQEKRRKRVACAEQQDQTTTYGQQVNLEAEADAFRQALTGRDVDKPGSARKRTLADGNVEMAAVLATTDPYAPPVTTDPYAPLDLLSKKPARKKRRKGLKQKSGQTVLDPYL